MPSRSHTVRLLVLPVFLIAALFVVPTPAQTDILDFSTIDEYTPTGRIGQIGPAVFSYDLYTHPDGFQWYNNSSAYNFYGENNEYIDFLQPVTLHTIDLAQFDPQGGLIVPASVILHLHDEQLNLIRSQEEFPTLVMGTVSIQTSGVRRLEFEFTGGGPFYGDGRDHAWYEIDNIVITQDRLTLDASPTEVSTNDLLTLTTSVGDPGGPMLLAAVDVSGVTVFSVVHFGTFNGAGTSVFSANVPAGLAGLDVTFAAIGRGQSGKLELSNTQLVEFQ